MATEKDRGRLILWRKVEDAWQWQNPLHRSAWIWMLMKAAFVNHDGLERGQLYFSLSQGPKVWGMSKTEAHRFLKKLSNSGSWNDYQPEIIWERGRGGFQATPVGTIIGTKIGTTPSLITIVNYDKYNPLPKKAGTIVGTPLVCSPGIYPYEKQSNKQSKNRRDSVESAPSPNSQLYDLYIETRRSTLDRPGWLPSKAQAIQMRANIKKMLENYPLDQLIEWLKNYLHSSWAQDHNQPWGLFAKDPISWQGRSEKPWYEQPLEGPKQ